MKLSNLILLSVFTLATFFSTTSHSTLSDLAIEDEIENVEERSSDVFTKMTIKSVIESVEGLIKREIWDSDHKYIQSVTDPNLMMASGFRGDLSPMFKSGEQKTFKMIVLHHTGDMKHTVQSIEEKHKKRSGWGDIGYHFIIPRNPTKDGGIFEARNLNFQGAHAGTKEGNERTIGVGLIGNFEPYHDNNIKGSKDGHHPTKFQVKMFRRLEKHFKDRYKNLTVKPHRVFNTEKYCPGKHAMFLVD